MATEKLTRCNKTLNGDNLSLAERKKREQDVKELQKMYPNLPALWLDLVWNFWNSKTEEEITSIIDSKEWEKPSTKFKEGGILENCITVEDKVE